MFALMCLVYCTKEKLLVPISSISVIIAGLYLFGWYSLKNTSQKSILGVWGRSPQEKNWYFGMYFGKECIKELVVWYDLLSHKV